MKNYRTKEQDAAARKIIDAMLDLGWCERPMEQYGYWHLVGDSLLLRYVSDDDGVERICEHRMEHGTVVARVLENLWLEGMLGSASTAGDASYDYVPSTAGDVSFYDYVPITDPTLEYLNAVLPLADDVDKEADAHYYDFANGMTFMMTLKPECRDEWGEDVAPGGYGAYETLTPLHTPFPDGALDVVEVGYR